MFLDDSCDTLVVTLVVRVWSWSVPWVRSRSLVGQRFEDPIGRLTG